MKLRIIRVEITLIFEVLYFTEVKEIIIIIVSFLKVLGSIEAHVRDKL